MHPETQEAQLDCQKTIRTQMHYSGIVEEERKTTDPKVNKKEKHKFHTKD